jgi:tRNA(Ile)-lysidine synthase TilS/MesJ
MRTSTFDSIAHVAIKELMEQHLTASRFGYIVTEECLDDICQEIVKFLKTSRSLKEAGDRMIATGLSGSSPAHVNSPVDKVKRWM